jgi:hypothetical protein
MSQVPKEVTHLQHQFRAVRNVTLEQEQVWLRPPF